MASLAPQKSIPSKPKVLATLHIPFIAEDGQEYKVVYGTLSRTADVISIGRVTIPADAVYSLVSLANPPENFTPYTNQFSVYEDETEKTTTITTYRIPQYIYFAD